MPAARSQYETPEEEVAAGLHVLEQAAGKVLVGGQNLGMRHHGGHRYYTLEISSRNLRHLDFSLRPGSKRNMTTRQ